MGIVARWKRYSANEILAKLRRADALAEQGASEEQIAADLMVTQKRLRHWRRRFADQVLEADLRTAKEELEEVRLILGRLDEMDEIVRSDL
ncbi:transposase [Nocardia sp. CNY236]|uniref:transposase n=1 Tax=Nocardia sp. CNY236 TaxID=1169152 RepID=UPI0004061A5C|nr:transposase [Nocardia sp. CNY236]